MEGGCIGAVCLRRLGTGALKAPTPTGTHVVKLPGGVGVYKILGKMGTPHRPILRTVAISGIAPEGAFAFCGGES
jgi:hypothetical protein